MMRKKTSPTILERAISMVPEYAHVLDKLDQQVALRGQSKSTLSNYGRRMALFVIHFQCLPHQVSLHIDESEFKGKFLDRIKWKVKKMDKLGGFNEQLQSAENARLVVYCEASIARAGHVMRYLGQYTHRIAISNHRIVSITDTHVTFKAKDYRDVAQHKLVTMEGVEFLRHFCLHVMPQGFVRIRRYGIYNHTTQRNLDLQFFTQAQTAAKAIEKKKERPQERIKRLTGVDVCRSLPHVRAAG